MPSGQLKSLYKLTLSDLMLYFKHPGSVVPFESP